MKKMLISVEIVSTILPFAISGCKYTVFKYFTVCQVIIVNRSSFFFINHNTIYKTGMSSTSVQCNNSVGDKRREDCILPCSDPFLSILLCP